MPVRFHLVHLGFILAAVSAVEGEGWGKSRRCSSDPPVTTAVEYCSKVVEGGRWSDRGRTVLTKSSCWMLVYGVISGGSLRVVVGLRLSVRRI